MTDELKPWLEQEVPPELRRLLVAARTQEPTLVDVQHVVTQLALTKASSGSSASIELTAGSATGSAMMGATWALLGGGLAGALAVGMAIVGGQRPDLPSDVVADKGASAIAVSSAQPLAPEKANSAEEHPSKSTRTAAPRPTLPPSRPTPRKSGISADSAWSSARSPFDAHSLQSTEGTNHTVLVPPPTPSELPQESQSAFVDKARNALKLGRPNETLRILDLYDQAYQTRTFVPEALQLRMRAQASLGNGTAAHQAAETLVARYPSTPQGKEAIDFLSR